MSVNSSAAPKPAECDPESSAKAEDRDLGGEDSMRRSGDALRRNLEMDRERPPHRPRQDRG